jgi:hypothetical protein
MQLEVSQWMPVAPTVHVEHYPEFSWILEYIFQEEKYGS